MNISGLVKELKREKEEVQRHIAGIDAALAAFAGVYTTKPKRRKMSASSRAKIAAAQRARWAKFRKSKG